MKRIIYILTIMVAYMIGMQSFSYVNSMNSYYNSNVADNIALIENKDNIYIYANFNNNAKDGINELLEYSKKHNQTIAFQMSKNDLGVTYNSCYIYSNNNVINNKIIKKEEIDFSKYDSKEWYSTFDDNADGKIVCLESNYYENYLNQYEIYNMYGVAEAVEKNGNSAVIRAYADNKNDLINHILAILEKNNISYVDASAGYSPAQLESLEIEEQTSINIVLYLSCILLFIMMILRVLKSKRKIMIFRLHGLSSLRIVLKEFLISAIINITVFFTVIMLVAYIKSGVLSVINKDYYYICLKSSFLFAMFNIFSLVLTYLYIHFFANLKYLKTEFNIKYIIETNLITKLIVIVLMLAPITNLFLKLNENIEQYNAYLKNEELITGLASVYLDGEVDKQIDLFNYLNETEGYYVDFNTYYCSTEEVLREENPNISERELKDSVIEYPFIIANANYLDEYNIKDITGNKIDLHNLKEDVILVPKQYQDIDYNRIMFGQDLEILFIDNNDSYLNYQFMEPYILINPVIRVVSKYSDIIQPWNMRVNLNNRDLSTYEKELKNVVEGELVFEKEIFFLRYIFKELKKGVMNTIFILLMYIGLLLLVGYQTTYLYISENQKILSLSYMNGISFVSRYKELFMYTLLSYFVLFTIGLLMDKTRIYSLIIFIICSLLLEIGIELLLIYRFERKNIANILKGEVF